MQSPVHPSGRSNRITSRGETTTWDDLTDPGLSPVSAFLTDAQLDALAAVWHGVLGSTELLIATPRRVDEGMRRELSSHGFTIHEADRTQAAEALREPVPGRLWLTTSGTTGRPKRVAHDLASLTTVTGGQPSRTWLLPYSPGTYAWWQLVTLSLAHPDQHLVTIDPFELESWPMIAQEGGVTAVSATPTFWRQALWQDREAVSCLDLKQVTLGGEPVDQSILDQLREAFPQARVSWIYASTEAGASIAVHDGQAGFPAAWLDRDVPGRPRLRVQADELLIESPHHGHGLDGLLRTGDRVELRDNRVLITGRLASDEINVGGSKIAASQVARVLLEHPGVAWTSVQGRRAPIVGTIVTAHVVVTRVVSASDLTSWCATRLPDYAVPRRLTFLEKIPLKESLKSDV